MRKSTARHMRRLVKDGLLIADSEQPWLELAEPDTLDTLNAASTRYRVTIGPDAGRRTFTLKNPGLPSASSGSLPLSMGK